MSLRLGLGRAFRVILVNSVAMALWMPHRGRLALLRFAGYRIGAAHLLSRSTIRCLSLTVGDGAFISHNCYLDRGDVTIGENVFISTGVTLVTGDHVPGTKAKRAGAERQAPMVVEDGCWIGANVVVLSGVRIASGCVIGAGAVVTRSTEPDGVYAGVPARRLRTLD